MTGENDRERLKQGVDRAVRRIRKSEQERRTLLSQTVYLGSLGMMMVLPIVGGAYLGRWLDEHLQGYSFSWTVTLIVIGVFVGSMNVYLFVKE